MVKVQCVICKRRCKGSVLRIDADFIHKECFKCIVCKCDLEKSGFHRRDGKFFCRKDYLNNFGVRCAICQEILDGEVMNMLGKTFHPDCFRCANCRNQFKGGDKATMWDNVYLCTLCCDKRRQPNYHTSSPSTPLTDSNSIKCNGGTSQDADLLKREQSRSSVRTNLGYTSKGHVRIQENTSSDEAVEEAVLLEKKRSTNEQTDSTFSQPNGYSYNDSFFSTPVPSLQLNSDSGEPSGMESPSRTPRCSPIPLKRTEEIVNVVSSYVSNSNITKSGTQPSATTASIGHTRPTNAATIFLNNTSCQQQTPPPPLQLLSQQQHQVRRWSPHQPVLTVRTRNRSAGVCDEPRWLSPFLSDHRSPAWFNYDSTDEVTSPTDSQKPYNFSYLHRQIEMSLNPEIPLRDHYHRSSSGYSTPISIQPGHDRSSDCRSPPQFHRPQGIRFSYRNIPSYRAEWRQGGTLSLNGDSYKYVSVNHPTKYSGIQRRHDGSIISGGNHADYGEDPGSARQLSAYPDARVPMTNKPHPIERPDWPSPPSSAVFLIEKNRQKCASLPVTSVPGTLPGGLQVVKEQQTPEHLTNGTDIQSDDPSPMISGDNATVTLPLQSIYREDPRRQTLPHSMSISPPTTQINYVIHRSIHAPKFTSPSCPTNLSSYLTPRPASHSHQVVNRLPQIYRQAMSNNMNPPALSDQKYTSIPSSRDKPNSSQSQSNHARTMSWTKDTQDNVNSGASFNETPGTTECVDADSRDPSAMIESTLPNTSIGGDGNSVSGLSPSDGIAHTIYCPPSVQDWLRPTEAGPYIHLPYPHFKSIRTAPQTYSYEVLKSPSKRPKGLDLMKLEAYLSDEDFRSLFPLNRQEFNLLPEWKRNDFKRRVGLF